MTQIELLLDSLRDNPVLPYVLNIFFSAVVSAIISWMFGARWIENNQRKRQHTEVLKEKSLKHLYTAAENIAPTKVRFNYEMERYESYPLQDLRYLP